MANHLDVRDEREAVSDGLMVWRPWQLRQFELFEGRAVSTPPQQHFTHGYTLLSIQSGIVHLQHQDTDLNSNIAYGTFLVIEPGGTWTCQIQDCTFHSLFIDSAWLQRNAAEQFQQEKSLLHFPDQVLVDPSLSRAVDDLATMSRSPVSRLQQEEAQLHLFARLLLSHTRNARTLRRPSWEHPAVERVKEYLQAHYVEEIALQDLADVANMSPFYLARVFRQVTGLPPHAYQTQLRLARARTLLAQGYDVGYVAAETGFFDQSHFTQRFRRHYVVTPGRYRVTAGFS